MNLLDKKAFGGIKLPVEKVELPDQGFVMVRGMTGAERDYLENLYARRRDESGTITDVTGIMAHVVIVCAVDDQGKPIFAQTPEDKALVQGLPAVIVGKIYDTARKLSGLGPEDLTAAKKASPSGPSEEPASGSPSSSTEPPENSSSPSPATT
jgi:hypothetical protein